MPNLVEIDFLDSVAAVAGRVGSARRRGLSEQRPVGSECTRPQGAVTLCGVIQDVKRGACDAAVGGPSKVLKQERAHVCAEADKIEWVELARRSAILGNCERSRRSVVSGIKCYTQFANHFLRLPLGQEFPPTVNGLLAWSALFRSAGTFQNYVNYVRVGCDLLSVSAEACVHSSVKRAAGAIAKRKSFVPRKKMFIRGRVVSELMGLPARGILRSCGDELFTAMHLFLVAYVFLLRLPSEALPIVVGGDGFDPEGEQAVVSVDDTSITLRLRRRKNKLHGSLLHRGCWCKSDTSTCPVHRLGACFKRWPRGSRPFAQFSAARALTFLRCSLLALKIPEALAYRTHDLRRGHARDMQENGHTLKDILKAGEWRSPAFLEYLDLDQLEGDAVLEAHQDESSDSE